MSTVANGAVVACALLLLACGAAPAHGRVARHAAPASAPSTAHALAKTGLDHLRRGDSLRAEQYLVLALRAGYPERALIVPLLEACLTASRLHAALRHAEPYLRRHPGDWRLRYVVAALHVGLGDAKRARAALRDGEHDATHTNPRQAAELRAWLDASVADEAMAVERVP